MKLRIGFFICAFLIPAMFIHGVARADDTPAELPCLEKIGEDPGLTNLLDMYFKEDDKLSTALLKGVKEELYRAISGYLFKYCTTYEEWIQIADADYFAFKFSFKNRNYHIKINSDALFKINPISVSIFFAPPEKKNFALIQPGSSDSAKEIIENELPTEIYFPTECSSRNPGGLRKVNTLVNVTSQDILGYANWYYFVDIGSGSYHIFKGLLQQQPPGGGPSPRIFEFSNFAEGRKKLKELATKLADGKACNGLVLYLVKFDPAAQKIKIMSEPIKIEN